MDSDEGKINAIVQLIDGCFVPELQREIGEIFLNTNSFDDFRQSLDICLIQLFDLIQRNEHLLYNTEKETLELRYKFLLLICEQLSSDQLCQTQNEKFIKNLHCLMEKHFMKILTKDRKVLQKIFDYYKSKLNANCWKRNIGTIHGCIKFCELYYEENSFELSSDAATFLLSVGLLLREFYEPSYKQLGYKLFYIILRRTPSDTITKINIQSVIYNAIVQDLMKIDSEKGIRNMTESLLECLKFYKVSGFHKWNKIDDLISTVFKRITLTTNAEILSILLNFLAKITLKFSRNFSEIEFYLNKERIFDNYEDAVKMREECSKIDSTVSQKWVKQFFKLIIAESNYTMANSKIAHDLLQAMCIFYLICIYPVPVEIMDIHLKEFFNKFSLILMEVLKINKQVVDVVKIIQYWLNTFQIQINEHRSRDSDFMKYYETFENIMKHDIFVKIKG